MVEITLKPNSSIEELDKVSCVEQEKETERVLHELKSSSDLSQQDEAESRDKAEKVRKTQLNQREWNHLKFHSCHVLFCYVMWKSY